jgi:CubicO group peptidase (beta-lactamase class C family)
MTMRRRVVLAALALLLAGCGAARAELHQITGEAFGLWPPPKRDGFRFGPFDPSSPPEARFQKLVDAWRVRLQQKQIAGGAIAVVLDGKLAFSAGVGVLRAGGHDPVKPESRFRSASISKMLIAAAVMTLVDRDGLDLSQPVTKLVPWFRRGPGYDADAVTLERLLTHTAAVPEGDGAPLPHDLRAAIEAHGSDPLWAPPGLLFNYSNSNYALLAAAIAAQTKMRFQDAVAERVLRPAGMTHAGYEIAPGEIVAAGHAPHEKVVWTTPTDDEASRAAGGVIASATDYAHFVEVLLAHGGNVLSPRSADAMMTGHVVMQEQPRRLYGYGLCETLYDGLRIVEHGGAAAGFTSLVRMVPARNFGVVALSNGTSPPEDVVDAATSAFLGLPETDRPRISTPPSSWASYAGHYHDEAGMLGRFDVTLEKDRLFLTLRGGQAHALPGDLRGQFITASDGQRYFVTRLGVARRESL